MRLAIGIDARYAFRQERRGIGEYVAHLLEGLAHLAPGEMHFFCYLDPLGDPARLALPAERFTLRRLPLANPLAFEEVGLPLVAAQDRLQLLHLTANYGPSLVPVRTLYTIHDVIEFRRAETAPWQQDLRHRLGRFVRTRTLPRQARRSCAVITPSRASAEEIAATLALPLERIVVIPHGAPALAPHPDPAALRQELRRRGYPVPETYILAFAALDPRKNGSVLVRAATSLLLEMPDVEFWLLGVEDVSRYPWRTDTPRIRLLPYLPRRDVEDLLAAATLFVYPSRHEGFGLPILEAMAVGVPVLAARSSSIPEVAGEAALLFPPEDASALEAALRFLLRDGTARDRLRAKGLARVRAFRWDDSVRRHIALYAKLAGFPSPGG